MVDTDHSSATVGDFGVWITPDNASLAWPGFNKAVSKTRRIPSSPRPGSPLPLATTVMAALNLGAGRELRHRARRLFTKGAQGGVAAISAARPPAIADIVHICGQAEATPGDDNLRQFAEVRHCCRSGNARQTDAGDMAGPWLGCAHHITLNRLHQRELCSQNDSA